VGDTIAIIGVPGEDISSLVTEPGPAKAEQAATGAPRPAARAAAGERAAVPSAGAAPSADAAPSAATSSGRIRTSPLARRLAEERGIDLRGVRGTGPGGRIVKRDLDAVGPERGSPPAGPATPADSLRRGIPADSLRRGIPADSLLTPAPGDIVVPLSPVRRIIARRLSESMRAAPHYYLTVSVGMDPLLEARARMNAEREKKISLNAFMMAVAGRLLARHSQVNSSWNGDTIIRHAAADIGLAVAMPEGLITPVVRDCGRKGILAIDGELADLVERARAGRLAPGEYAGATFTISSLGSAGIDEFTAIIKPPGSAILAVGAIRKEPVVADGDAIVVRQRMRATLSCDHRVIDGAVGAAFLRELADMLENPVLALA